MSDNNHQRIATGVRRFLTLRVRLFAGFVVLAAVAIMVTAFFLNAAASTNIKMAEAKRLMETAGLFGSLNHAVVESAIPPRDYLINRSPNESKEWTRDVLIWQKLWTKVRTSASSADQGGGPALLSISADLDRLQQAEAEVFTAKDQAKKTLLMRDISLLQRRVGIALERHEGVERARADSLMSEAVAVQGRISIRSKAAMVLIALVALGLGFLAHISVMKPLRELEYGVRQVAGGKLDHRINSDRQDEIGSLAREFNDMTVSLKQSYTDLRRRYSQLTNLYKISKAVSTTHDLDQLLHLVLRQSLDLMGADTGSIMLITPSGRELKIRAAEGLDEETVAKARVKLGEGISGYVAATGKPLMIQNGVRKARVPGGKDVQDALSVPLIANEKVIGVINANNKHGNKFDRQDLRFFTTLAGQIAAAISNATLVDNIQEAYFNTIKVLAAAIDAKDKYTHGHSERVAKYAVTIGRQLGLSREDLTRIEAAGYLHDIGKIGVPDSILNKEGPLTDEEFDMIKQHPVKAAEILGHINLPWGDVVPGVRGHHERYDGRGYPDSIAGEDISRDARIIAVADSFDAMTSDRPYRKGLDRTTAITELVKGRAMQFDSEAVDAFIPALLTEWMSSLPGPVADQPNFFAGASPPLHSQPDPEENIPIASSENKKLRVLK